jgi:hypothetical protein
VSERCISARTFSPDPGWLVRKICTRVLGPLVPQSLRLVELRSTRAPVLGLPRERGVQFPTIGSNAPTVRSVSAASSCESFGTEKPRDGNHLSLSRHS